MDEDRELLELAARAAGLKINVVRQAERDAAGYGHVGLWIPEASTGWNPLISDADALRLVVKLRLDMHNEDQWWPEDTDKPTELIEVYCMRNEEAGSCHCETQERGSDPYAATRRAIVRAAAKIGEAKNV